MKSIPSKSIDSATDPRLASPVGRRGLVVGAGVAGAAALAAHALHRGIVATPAAGGAAKTAAAGGDGYQVTPHVLRYYETTKA